MLKFNHVTISNSKKVIVDSNFRFDEGIYYCLKMPKEDYNAVFECIDNTKKTDAGLITTWRESLICRPLVEGFLPEMITVKEFFAKLEIFNDRKGKSESAMSSVGITEEEKEMLIGKLSKEALVKVRAAVLITLKPYISLIESPFPEDEVLKKVLAELGEFNIYLF